MQLHKFISIRSTGNGIRLPGNLKHLLLSFYKPDFPLLKNSYGAYCYSPGNPALPLTPSTLSHYSLDSLPGHIFPMLIINIFYHTFHFLAPVFPLFTSPDFLNMWGIHIAQVSTIYCMFEEERTTIYCGNRSLMSQLQNYVRSEVERNCSEQGGGVKSSQAYL